MRYKMPQEGDVILTRKGHELKPRKGQKDFSVTLGLISKVESFDRPPSVESNLTLDFVYPLRLYPCVTFGGLTLPIINRPICNYMSVAHCPTKRYSPNTRKVVVGREEIMETLRSCESLAPHADWIRDYNPRFSPEELLALERSPDKMWI